MWIQLLYLPPSKAGSHIYMDSGFFNKIWDYDVQMSGMLQPLSAQNWLGSQGSSSGLIVKRTIRVDIPVDKYPNVQIIFFFPCKLLFLLFLLHFLFLQPLTFISCCSITLLGAFLVLEEIPLSEWKLTQSAVS